MQQLGERSHLTNGDVLALLATKNAEIERLRKEHDDLLTKALGVEAERDIARDEIERLRVATEKFLEGRMRHFHDSRTVDDDLVELAAALSSGK